MTRLITALCFFAFFGALFAQTDPSTQAANTWARQYRKAAMGDVTHPYENDFSWDYKNEIGVVFAGHLGTYYGMNSGNDVPEIMNTNMTYAFSFSDNQFHKVHPAERPPKRCGVRTVYDEGWGHTLALGGCFHNYDNSHLEPSIRFDALQKEAYYNDMDYSTPMWAFNGASRQWYAMRPLIVEGPPKGSFLFSGYYFNMVWAKEYGLALMVPTAYNMVYSYSTHFNQWTRLPRNTGDPAYPTEERYICATYDTRHHKMVAHFGNSTTINETWTYDVGTKSWVKLNTGGTNPPNGTSTSLWATHSSIGYDRMNGKIIYVKNDGSATWALDLDNPTWQNLNPTGRPGSGSWGTMEYDPKRNVSVLFTVANDEIWTYKYGQGIANRPEPPEKTAGVTSATGINITWSAPSTGPAPVKYYVYRCEWDDNLTVSSGIVPKGYSLLDSTTQTSYADNNTAVLTAAKVFHSYYIAAVSAQGLVSDPTHPVFTNPRVPMGLTATPLSANSVFLRWKPKQEADLAGYNVYRMRLAYPKHNHLKAGKLNTALVSGTPVFSDNSITLRPTMGTVDSIVMYVVTAVNLLGKESGFSPYTITHPDWVNNMWVDTTARIVHWSPPRSGRIANYRIYAGRQGSWDGGSSRPSQIATTADTFWSYAGRTLSAYKVRAFNLVGQLGFYSDVMAVQTKDDDMFGNFRLDFQMNRTVRDPFYDDLPPVSVENGAASVFPGGMTLSAAPNPFKPAVAISWTNSGMVETIHESSQHEAPKLAIYDIHGRMVQSFQAPANGRIVWNAADQASGMYLIRLVKGEKTVEKKIYLIK
jgi:hypothetical protein